MLGSIFTDQKSGVQQNNGLSFAGRTRTRQIVYPRYHLDISNFKTAAWCFPHIIPAYYFQTESQSIPFHQAHKPIILLSNMGLITGISHVNLLVPAGTLSQARAFYGKTLGFESVPVPILQRETLAWYAILYFSFIQNCSSCCKYQILGFTPLPPSTPQFPTYLSKNLTIIPFSHIYLEIIQY